MMTWGPSRKTKQRSRVLEDRLFPTVNIITGLDKINYVNKKYVIYYV